MFLAQCTSWSCHEDTTKHPHAGHLKLFGERTVFRPNKYIRVYVAIYGVRLTQVQQTCGVLPPLLLKMHEVLAAEL